MLSFLGLGCLAGLLSGLFGIGGGIILVPTLAILFARNAIPAELVMSLACGTSLAAMSLSTLTAGLRHHAKGAVNWPLLWSLVPGTAVGAIIGVRVASILPAFSIKVFFCIMVCGVGLNMMLGQSTLHYRGHAINAVGWCALGLAVGICAGLLGIGGGVLLVPLLCYLGINLTQASATASMCTFPIVLAGSVSAMIVGWGVQGLPVDTIGFVYWPAIWMIGLTSIVSAVIGVELSHRLPVKMLRKFFGAVLIALAIAWFVILL